MDVNCVTEHAVVRYRERVERADRGRITQSEHARVASILLHIPLVSAALKAKASTHVKTSWGRVVVHNGVVMTVLPLRDQRVRPNPNWNSRHGRRTRTHRLRIGQAHV